MTRHMHKAAAIRRYRVRRAMRSRILGTGLLAAGALWLLDTSGYARIETATILSAFLIVVGIGMVLAAKWGPYGGLVVLSVFVVLVLVSMTSIGGPILSGIGEMVVEPTAPEDLSAPHELALGDMTIDLTNVDFPAGETLVSGRLNIGHLKVVVPADAEVRAINRIFLGDIHFLGRHREISAIPGEVVLETPDYARATTRLLLALDVGLGEIEVVRDRP